MKVAVVFQFLTVCLVGKNILHKLIVQFIFIVCKNNIKKLFSLVRNEVWGQCP
jgi:hypothetical protein